MATIKIHAAPETVLPEGTRAGNDSSSSPAFAALVAFCLEAEKADESLRIIEVITTDKNAPDSIRLKYSFPPCMAGLPGYKTSKDKVVSFK
jgi:hypothetical protein